MRADTVGCELHNYYQTTYQELYNDLVYFLARGRTLRVLLRDDIYDCITDVDILYIEKANKELQTRMRVYSFLKQNMELSNSYVPGCHALFRRSNSKHDEQVVRELRSLILMDITKDQVARVVYDNSCADLNIQQSC